MLERASTPALRLAGAAAIALGVAIAGCASSVNAVKPTVKKPTTAAAVASKARSFQIKFTDAKGTEKADPASQVVIKVNGKAVTTKITNARTVLSLDDAPDDAVVEADLGSSQKVLFKAGDVPAADPATDAGTTVWLMPWKSGQFLGQVGPDTHPMTTLKGRSTRVPIGTSLADTDLQRAYVGSYRLPRHLIVMDGATANLDQSYVFCLAAAAAAGDKAPALSLLVTQGGANKLITVKVKAWPDTAPVGDTPPVMRTTNVDVTADQLDGTPTTTDVPDVDKLETETLKVQDAYFPAPAGS